ncbi:MAG: hypothetical protein GX142_10170 [Chloroflexi bacterium]|nr:hypothetical protein [Chloroflexota bacterium]
MRSQSKSSPESKIMHAADPHHPNTTPEENHGRDPHEIIPEIQQGAELLMAAIQELIEWTTFDLAEISDYLKRINNFLQAVIEAHPKTYSMAFLAHTLALDEATLRRLLHNVGARIDITATDPEEIVTEDDVIALLADRAGSPVGDRLMDLLRGDGPYVTW